MFLLCAYFGISVSAKVFAVVVAATPSLGLLDVLYHFEIGKLPMEAGLYDLAGANETAVWGEDAWKPLRYGSVRAEIRYLYLLFT